MLKEYAIITAGGKGSRMGSDMPKQFMPVNGLPMIMHGIRAFKSYSDRIGIVVVLPEDAMEAWDRILEEYPPGITCRVATGGKTRFASVKNGLELTGNEGQVAIHDAARPLVSAALIDRCFRQAEDKGNAVPVIPLTDSLRELSNDESRPAERDRFRRVQTPQVFETGLIRKAYEQAYRPSFTDDASVAESIGVKINLVEGEEKNVKITTPLDIIFAEALMKANI
jgi:2-C-methyl-D-erythritol 4-phosphate cytidylyltransferase